MYRFKTDLNLDYLVGRDVGYIGIDQCNLYLTLNAEVISATRRNTGILENVVMDSSGSISIYGSWILTDKSDQIVDECMEHEERKSYQIHVLLGLKLLSYAVTSEKILKLNFEKGYCLKIIDDDSPYETVSISFGDTRIIV